MIYLLNIFCWNDRLENKIAVLKPSLVLLHSTHKPSWAEIRSYNGFCISTRDGEISKPPFFHIFFQNLHAPFLKHSCIFRSEFCGCRFHCTLERRCVMKYVWQSCLFFCLFFFSIVPKRFGESELGRSESTGFAFRRVHPEASAGRPLAPSPEGKWYVSFLF